MMALGIAAVVGIALAFVRMSMLPWITVMGTLAALPVTVAAAAAAGVRTAALVVGTLAASLASAYLIGGSLTAAWALTAAAWIAMIPILRVRARLPVRAAIVLALALIGAEFITTIARSDPPAWRAFVLQFAVTISGAYAAATITARIRMWFR